MTGTSPRTLTERIGDWSQAFETIRGEITTPAMRAFIGAFEGQADIATLRSFQDLAKMVCANDRAAAMVAAMLVPGTGARVQTPDLDLGD